MNSADLVARLRFADKHSQQRVMGSRIFGEAADRIEALEARLAEARKALRQVRLQDRVTRHRGTEQQFYEDGPCGKIARRLVEKEDGR